MTVHRGGRYVYAMPGELNRWLAQESHSRAPIHITTGSEDLTADLKHALSEARHKRKPARKTSWESLLIPFESNLAAVVILLCLGTTLVTNQRQS